MSICIGCKIELDPEEYSDPRDADICGYCFAAQLSLSRQEHPNWTERELGVLTDLRIRSVLSECQDFCEKVIRLMESYR